MRIGAFGAPARSFERKAWRSAFSAVLWKIVARAEDFGADDSYATRFSPILPIEPSARVAMFCAWPGALGQFP